MPGIAGFKKGFKKLFNFVKKVRNRVKLLLRYLTGHVLTKCFQSDEKTKKQTIEDENRSKTIQNNKIVKEYTEPKQGNEKSSKVINDVTHEKTISSLENINSNQLNKKTELVENHVEKEVIVKEDDALQNNSKTLLDNGKDETWTNTIIDDKTETENLQQEQNSDYKTTKPTAVVKPCQKIEVEDEPKEIDDDSLKKSKFSLNNEFSSELPTPATQDKEIDIKRCEAKEEKPIEHEVIHTKEPKTEEDILEIDLKLKSVDKEIIIISEEIKIVEASNMQMMIIVDEFEKTINQLMEEKEREEVCQQIIMDRILNEKEDIIRDHKNVERAFGDLTDKYERARSIVPGLKMCEDKLKKTVSELSARYVYFIC